MTTAAPFDLASIKPSRGEMDGSGKFSPNLYRWLMKQTRGIASSLDHIQVYRGKCDVSGKHKEILYIGFIDADGWFSGARLIRVLCEGARKQAYAFMPDHVRSLGLKPVRNFWRDYRKHGRCAIDKEHARFWVNDTNRWHVKGKTRTCNWCGAHKQCLKVRTETKRTVVKTWVAA